MLAKPEQLKIVMAVLLLAPSPPMLFMGEEFAAATPFQYFCDFQGELAKSVAEGRRHEFDGFRKFADPTKRASIPDPIISSTFQRCKLLWDCLDEPQHNAWLTYYRSILMLRHKHVVLRLLGMDGGAKFEMIGSTGLTVHWRLGDGSQLRLLANLGGNPVEGVDTYAGKAFYLSRSELKESLDAGNLPSWSVAWFINETPL